MYRNSYKCLFWFWVQKANINIYKLNTLTSEWVLLFQMAKAKA